MKSPVSKEESPIDSSPRDVAYSQLEIGRRIKITGQLSNNTTIPDAEVKFKLL